MGNGGIESEFRFIAYKIHDVALKTKPIAIDRQISPDEVWQIKLGVRTPKFYVKKNIYIGGINCGLFLLDKDPGQVQRDQDNTIVSVEMSITGMFQVKAGRLAKRLEEQLARIQIPALLFPYVRGAVTSLMAHAGFGSVIIPLINMNEVGKEALKDKEIEIIED